MTESYKARRARWLKVRNAFPGALQDVSLRNVDAISSLPKELQLVLAETVGHVKNTSRAAKMLRDHPDLSSEELVLAMNCKTAKAPTRDENNQAINISPEDIAILADVLHAFCAQMPRQTTGALAASAQAIADTLAVVAITRIATSNAKSDFAIFSLYEVLNKYRNELAGAIKNNSNLEQAIKKTAIREE